MLKLNQNNSFIRKIHQYSKTQDFNHLLYQAKRAITFFFITYKEAHSGTKLGVLKLRHTFFSRFSFSFILHEFSSAPLFLKKLFKIMLKSKVTFDILYNSQKKVLNPLSNDFSYVLKKQKRHQINSLRFS